MTRLDALTATLSTGWRIAMSLADDGLSCPHGNPSGDCPECRNGIDPTTGDVA